jgi:hypothetical protein
VSHSHLPWHLDVIYDTDLRQRDVRTWKRHAVALSL